MLAAVILAAGESRRMGTPKALLPFPGRDETFLHHVISIAQHARIGARRVVLGAYADQVRARVVLSDADVVVNEDWKAGQLSSIQAGLRSLPPNTDGMMLFLVDHPLVTTEIVGELVSNFDSSKRAIVVPTYDGKRGHPVIFASRLYDELLAAPANQGARAVVWAHEHEVLEMPTAAQGVVLNFNDPESVKAYLPG